MSTEHTIQAGIGICTSITAGGDQQQHAEATVTSTSTSARHPNAPRGRVTLPAAVKARQSSGNDIAGIAASTAITAGGYMDNHVEGIVVSTSITGGGWADNHAEGLVVWTSITAGGWIDNHAEGVVVSTAITAGGLAGQPRRGHRRPSKRRDGASFRPGLGCGKRARRPAGGPALNTAAVCCPGPNTAG